MGYSSGMKYPHFTVYNHYLEGCYYIKRDAKFIVMDHDLCQWPQIIWPLVRSAVFVLCIAKLPNRKLVKIWWKAAINSLVITLIILSYLRCWTNWLWAIVYSLTPHGSPHNYLLNLCFIAQTTNKTSYFPFHQRISLSSITLQPAPL